ncbi:MAG: AEC family transporter [Rhodoferax sp.]|uniref:AEC family transporter n=1 Tax=Rhodoferax sp. TaxID=50421 RepID=UPI001B46CCE9|nr:AEC family transporter [Rhodoferax sp.]MBP9906628.1 AEC family transporter [Rhodoferax sp.]
MNNPVFSSLLPVVLLIAIGVIAGRSGWIRAEATKDLSNLVFVVLTPALLFRAMSSVHIEQLNFKPVALYFVAVALLYAVVFVAQGHNTRAAVLGLAATFSNTVMIGIPLIGLAYGQAALVLLLTLISVHALILLTVATIVLEIMEARQLARSGQALGAAPPRHAWQTVLSAIKNGIIHPVPLPIIIGLLFAQTGLVIPEVLDRPLQLLGNAFGPVALLLVGATLTQVHVGPRLRAALGISLLKNLVLPTLVAGVAWLAGSRGLDLTVMIVAASLPMGANVFLFAQRYQVAQDLVTASMAVSSVLGLVTITLVMSLLRFLV